MLKEALSSKYIRGFLLVVIITAVVGCFSSELISSVLQNMASNIAERPSSIEGSSKYMTYTLGHPTAGYSAKGNDDGWKIIADNGDVLYETKRKVELANRAGYIYEIGDDGRYFIVNIESGKVEWSGQGNETIVEDDAGFWVVKVKVDDQKYFSKNYYYLLDENYRVAADGIIFNSIGNDQSLGRMENYIYGQVEDNFTYNNREGIEEREWSHRSSVVNSNGEIVYSTKEGTVWYVTEDDMACVSSNYSERDDFYVSLAGPTKGQVVEVAENE